MLCIWYSIGSIYELVSVHYRWGILSWYFSRTRCLSITLLIWMHLFFFSLGQWASWLLKPSLKVYWLSFFFFFFQGSSSMPFVLSISTNCYILTVQPYVISDNQFNDLIFWYPLGVKKISISGDLGTGFLLHVSNVMKDVSICMLSDENFSEVICPVLLLL